MVLWPPKDVRPGRTLRVAAIVALVAGAIALYPSPRSATPATIDSGSAPVTCTETQRAPVTAAAPWRCTAMFARNRSYVVRVDRQQVDVTLELDGPNNKRVLRVDSPTHRAGPEFLLYRSPTGGKHVLVVDTDETGAPPAVLNVELREMRDTSVGGALSKGLAALTTAATVSNNSDQADAERRIAQLRAALPDLKAAGARELEAEALFRIAAVYYWVEGNWVAAAEAANEAIKAYLQLSQPLMAERAAVIRAASLLETAGPTSSPGAKVAPKSRDTQFGEVEKLLVAAAGRFRAADMKFDEAFATNYLGLSFLYQGRAAEARKCFEDAARLYGALDERSSQTLPLQNIASLDYERGDYAQAVTGYEHLLHRVDPASDRSNYISILNNLGTAQYVLGNTDKAVAALMTALSLSADGSDPSDRARTLHALGRTYLIVGDEERGAVFLSQALELRRTVAGSDRRGLLISLLRMGDMYRDRLEVDEALKLHLEALDHAVSPSEKTRVLLAVGQDQMASGAIGPAIETFERALKLDLPRDWPVRVAISGEYGYALMRVGNVEGRALLVDAARSHEEAGDDEFAARDYYLLASEDRRAGKTDSALGNLPKALALFDAQRTNAVNPDLRATYISNRSTAYALQAELYMSLWERSENAVEKAQLASAALGSTELIRTRALEDFRQFAQPAGATDASTAAALNSLDSRLAAKRHRLATLLDQQHPSADNIAAQRRDIALLRTQLDVAQERQNPAFARAPSKVNSFSLPALRQSLEAGALVVTWLLGEERSWIWCISRESADAFPLPAGRDVERAAATLLELWSQPVSIAANRAREMDASRTILGPAAAILSTHHTVTFVADGALRTVPLAALWLPEGDRGKSRRVVESSVVSYRPSLHRWRESPVIATTPQTQLRMLLVGDPVIIGEAPASATTVAAQVDVVGDPMTQLQPLPASRREIAGIVKISDRWHADVLVGEAATKHALLRLSLNTYQVLHFATHARLDVRDPQLSSILLSSPRAQLGQSSSALTLREIIGLRLDADTVVLSACEGSLGKQYRGQLSLGLSEAFLLGGASHVLGGLWRVSDAATERYMQNFYEFYIRRGVSAGAAAQSAARAMMNDPMYGHPFYWAAFVILAV